MKESAQEQGVGEAVAIIHFISSLSNILLQTVSSLKAGAGLYLCLMLSTLLGTVGVLKTLDE